MVAKNINNTHNPVFYFNLLLNKRFVNKMKPIDFYYAEDKMKTLYITVVLGDLRWKIKMFC